MTSDGNIRAWLRARERAEDAAMKATQRLEIATDVSKCPWGEVRPATAEDVRREDVLWKPCDSGPGWTWLYIEEVLNSGEFRAHDGNVYHFEGMSAEVPSNDPRDAALDAMLGERRPSPLAILDVVRAAATSDKDITVSVSPDAFEKIDEELKKIQAVRIEGVLFSIFGMHIVADPKLSDSGIGWTSSPKK